MSLGSTAAAPLVQRVSDFAAATTCDGQLAQLDAVIDVWARTTGRVDTFWLRPVTASPAPRAWMSADQ